MTTSYDETDIKREIETSASFMLGVAAKSAISNKPVEFETLCVTELGKKKIEEANESFLKTVPNSTKIYSDTDCTFLSVDEEEKNFSHQEENLNQKDNRLHVTKSQLEALDIKPSTGMSKLRKLASLVPKEFSTNNKVNLSNQDIDSITKIFNTITDKDLEFMGMKQPANTDSSNEKTEGLTSKYLQRFNPSFLDGMSSNTTGHLESTRSRIIKR